MRVMRVVAAVVMTLGLAIAPAAAQTIGFKIGPTFSKADVDDEEGGAETLESFGGGGFIRFGFAGFVLQAEVLALTKGAATSIPDGVGGTFDAELKMNYIEIPLTAMFSFGSGPYIFAGPSVAFETGCEVEFGDDSGSIEADCDDEEGQIDRKKVDFSLIGGAGFQFAAGPGHILLEGRYIYGISDIADDPSATDSQFKHRTWFVAAGYAIPIGSVR